MEDSLQKEMRLLAAQYAELEPEEAENILDNWIDDEGRYWSYEGYIAGFTKCYEILTKQKKETTNEGAIQRF